ncbi:glycoside hydrolase, partial [Bacillus cereus]|nr:glycoside hydrolase [Bacillus cereus]
NVPLFYHLDEVEWDKHKKEITEHLKVWNEVHEKAVKEEMTNFAYLSEDKLVQSVSYGKDIKIIVNFSNEDMEIEKTKIKAKSAYIDNQGKKSVYTPFEK